MNTEGWISITVLTAIIGCLIGIFTFYFARKKDAKTELEEHAKKDEAVAMSLTSISNDLRWVRNGVDEIKITLNEQAKEQSNIKIDIGKIEVRLNAAESDIQKLKDRINKED